jgi:putative ABC transport system permease protein
MIAEILFAAVDAIPLARMAIVFLPVLVVLWLLWRWAVEPGMAVYALGRMLLQLMVIGYALTGIFRSSSPAVVVGVLALMIAAASYIALRTVPTRSWRLYGQALLAIALGGGSTLLLVTQIVLDLEPWFDPQLCVPLAGMIFPSAMNTLSLAAERLFAEQASGALYLSARNTALRAAMIPTVNGLLAVGLVSIPGMMTGQVLSGVDPLIAARYQIMVMAMIFAASGLSAALFLAMQRPTDGEKRSGV